MIKLSVIIITLNEERNLERCLSSVREIADEILILDSFSTDKTKEIAENYGAHFIQKEFEGYVKARRTVESLAAYDYILAIDADEALSEELSASISELKKNWNYDGYFIARKTNYCGQWIHHSAWYPDRKLRLYKRGSGQWEGKYVHEKYTLFPDKKTGRLKGDLLHYSYYKQQEHWDRTEKYAQLSALELFEKNRTTSLFHAYFKALFKFFRGYFLNFGFLDGRKGYEICKIVAWGTYKKYALLLELKKNKKPLKVLHISSAVSWRGGEQQLLYLHQALQNKNIEQIVVCPLNSKLYQYLLNSENANLIGYKKSPLFSLFFALRIKRICNQEKISLIHAHDSHAHSFAFLSSLIYGNKTPLIVHRRVAFPVSNSWLSKLKYNHKSIHLIVCVSEVIKNLMSKNIRNSNVLKVVHDGIDLNRFPNKSKTHRLRSLLNISDDTFIIGNTSAIDRYKDYYTFVDTAEIILQSIPKVHFVVIGSGSLENEIKAYINQKQLTDYFSFTGFRVDIPELLPDFDLFLMTTRIEGLGTSLLDAFACRVPVVSTNAGGIVEIIKHKVSGMLANIGDSKQLAENAIQLLNDEILRENIVDGATKTLQNFTTNKMANNIISLYSEI